MAYRKMKDETMESIFQLWELHLFRKIEALEFMIDQIMVDMSMSGYRREQTRPFIEKHIQDMREQAREKLENKRKKVHAV